MHLTKGEADNIQWALCPMVELWCTDEGMEARCQNYKYDIEELPTLNGREFTLSDIEELNDDLCDRLFIQLDGMASQEPIETYRGVKRILNSLDMKFKEEF